MQGLPLTSNKSKEVFLYTCIKKKKHFQTIQCIYKSLATLKNLPNS